MDKKYVDHKGFRLAAPYWPHAVFVFGMIEFMLTAAIMAICWKFYSLASTMLPYMFEIFRDTVKKQEVIGIGNYTWDNSMEKEFINYENKLIQIYTTSVLIILITMVVVISQFVRLEHPHNEDKTYSYCMTRRNANIIFAIILGIFILINMGLITHLWLTGKRPYDLFNDKYASAIHEEHHWEPIVERFACVNDEDKEVHKSERCDFIVGKSIISQKWLDMMFYSYILVHLIGTIAFGFLNQNCGTYKAIAQEEEENDTKSFLP